MGNPPCVFTSFDYPTGGAGIEVVSTSAARRQAICSPEQLWARCAGPVDKAHAVETAAASSHTQQSYPSRKGLFGSRPAR